MSGGTRPRGGRWPERTAAVAGGDTGNGYVETDPTGRYGRFDDLLGKGAMKSAYRGFDEERGVEVAWNQASLGDVLRSPDAVQRMHSEVQLLRALRHDAIIGFHASWVDARRRTFNFITELFSSGTLRSYRLRYPRVSLRAVRSWARQILRGLAYLHAHDPPVIHRDLKCDNVFVNGHRGQVKIGDLGLAAVLRSGGGGVAHSVIGTPEFMAPEMYDEEYDERVDVYAFGMCVLEMVTVEYPYSECSNPAQIYKKVTAGKLPDAFYRVEDEDARRFIGRCLVAASARPSAAELLLDPFLVDDHHYRVMATSPTPAVLVPAPSSFCGSSDDVSVSSLGEDDDGQEDVVADEPAPERPGRSGTGSGMTITGKLNAEEDTIFLKVQLPPDEAGHARNIYFPFDMASDTAAEVASEMVKELDITDRDAAEIAAMIEQEIDRLLLPGRAQQQQHEYTYAAHDDDGGGDNEGERPPPFYYLSSSPTSSQGSYGSGGRGFPAGPHVGGWSKDDWEYALSDDDDTNSSMHSGKYSALHYAPGHEEEEAEAGPSCSSPKTRNNNTRFGPGEESPRGAAGRTAQEHGAPAQVQPQRSAASPSPSPSPPPHAGRPRRREDGPRHAGRRMTRNRSMVDMRSQLLHRTLVEELNRRLFFNTVGAVESVGFRAPSSSASPSAAARGRRIRDGVGQQRHYML